MNIPTEKIEKGKCQMQRKLCSVLICRAVSFGRECIQECHRPMCKRKVIGKGASANERVLFIER